ncbi:MAG: SlyX family protein [Methylobacterium sp.]|uniref:SlyX family protein n=1 Tax=Methylobacterium sp. TaxID=409 RepID=UPI0025F8117A|nr:SlyX family protein [Methylobacterium sp.]MBX9929962.1 SlyX family protein [Methylobacterium sp.]
MSDADLAERIVTLEMRLTEQDLTLEDLNRTITEQWRLIDRLSRQIAALQERIEEAGNRPQGGAAEQPPPHY